MIELDDTKHHDFLSDEARSGFGDDDESFGLGRHSEAQSTEQEHETEQDAASHVEICAVDVAPKEIEISKDEEKTQQPEAVENPIAVVAEERYEEPVVEMSNDAMLEASATSELETIHSAEDNISVPEIDAEDLPEEKHEEPSVAATIPTAHEAYIPPVYAHLDTIITENASTDGSRKVITIPGAEEQRKEDAEKAAARAAQSNINTPRRNTWSRNAIAASLAGILLAALVASGYMLMRKTTIGSGAQNLWATLTGGRAESGVQDTAALTLLDLTKKSQEKNAQNNENQNLLNNTANTNNTSSEGSASANVTSANSQTANAHNTQALAAQNSNAAVKTESSAVSASSQNKPTTLAANTPLPPSQAQEKATQAAPTTKQISGTKQTTPAASSTKQPNSQATKSASNKQETSIPAPTTAKAKQASSASALERKQTQQISGVFAIQVYATPSIADAEDWVERLKRRGMVNAMVTSQVVRGQMMYRVRFGLYNTLHEAERDAERFGYMGSWVVRLR
ncbi:MAG: SPOR domain-containing protein [Candidatus Kapabacteria bacterium]|nr:SPOR domain-containing protein [Candidatus Kapabacteria bacterium]